MAERKSVTTINLYLYLWSQHGRVHFCPVLPETRLAIKDNFGIPFADAWFFQNCSGMISSQSNEEVKLDARIRVNTRIWAYLRSSKTDHSIVSLRRVTRGKKTTPTLT